MTNENPQNVNISVEQVCAAILATVGPVEVELSTIMGNYAGKSISVNQNEETKALTFSLADAPEIQAENE